jgi:hypothetical protein
MPAKKSAKSKSVRAVKKIEPAVAKSCKELKAAIAREIKASVKDRAISAKLINSLGVEVAYGTGGGGGGGVGVA